MESSPVEPALFSLIRDGSIEALRIYLRYFPAALPLPVYRDQAALTVAVKACFAFTTPVSRGDAEDEGDNDAFECRFQVLRAVAEHCSPTEWRSYIGRTVFHAAVITTEDDTVVSPTEALVSCAVLDILLDKLPCASFLFVRDDFEQTALHTAMLHGNWKAATKLLLHMHNCPNVSYHDYDYIMDTEGNSNSEQVPLLQMAIYHNPSRKFLKVLLSQFPESPSVPSNDDKLPLVTALEHALPARKVKLLVTAYPEALALGTGDGDLPLHLAALYYQHKGSHHQLAVLELLVQPYPAALSATNCHGQFPLHCAMEYPEQQHEEQQQRPPLDLSVLQLLSNHHGTVDSDDYESQSTSSPMPPATEGGTSDEDARQRSIQSLIFAVGQIEDSDLSSSSSDGSLAENGYCPPRPQQHTEKALLSGLYHKDCYGELPLHIACRRLSSISVDIMTWLLDCHPQSASLTNDYGHLPLHLAAAAEYNCSEDSDETTTSIAACIQLLIAAHLPALWQADDEGDIPLQCAVTHSSTSSAILQCFLEVPNETDDDAIIVNNSNNKADCCPENTHHPTTNLITGKLPLHTACAHGLFSADVLDPLISYHPDALRHYDNNGHLPFHVALLAPVPCPVPVLRQLLFASSAKSDEAGRNGNHLRPDLQWSRSTLPCAERGSVPALLVACDGCYHRTAESTATADDDDASLLDTIRFLVERSPELFVRHRLPTLFL